ncbi:uncharacterized protein LOC144097345 [Amblyomma americanum]
MNRVTAVLPAILRARNSSQARDPTHRPRFTALTSVLCFQLPASIGPCVLPAFDCVIPLEPFMFVGLWGLQLLDPSSHCVPCQACTFESGPGATLLLSGCSAVEPFRSSNQQFGDSAPRPVQLVLHHRPYLQASWLSLSHLYTPRQKTTFLTSWAM